MPFLMAALFPMVMSAASAAAAARFNPQALHDIAKEFMMQGELKSSIDGELDYQIGAALFILVILKQ